MILLTSSWFNDPEYNFKISHKVSNLIRDEIRNIMLQHGLSEKDKDWYLNLVVTTDRNIKELEVRGPELRKRAKFIDYGLWLPHDKINNSAYPLEEYINCYFEALKKVLLNYNIPSSVIEPIKDSIKAKVLNNAEYEYKP